MQILRKILVFTVTAFMLFTMCPVSGVFAEDITIAPLGNSENVVRIGALADSHIGNENGSKKFEKALKTFSALDPDYEGLSFSGDIALQYGTVADDYKVESAPYDIILSDMDTYANGKPYSWAMGNHEFPYACVLKVSQSEAQTELMKAAIKTAKEYYVEKTGMSLNDDVVIGGYHFISAAPIDYSNCYDAEAENYIMAKIDELIAADGNEKPIFLNAHHAPWYTTLSSTETVYEIPYSKTLTDYLSNHPNVIVLTGHTHNSEYDPRTIWQGGYTVINVGYTSNSSGATITGEAVYPKDNQEALMIEIDKNNVVRLKRIDVKNQCIIGEDWVLDIPNMVNNPKNETYWKYTDSRYDASPVPYFAEGSEVSTLLTTETTARLSFPSAKINAFMGDDIIRYYNVKVVNKKLQSLVQDYNISSDFYNPASKRANPFQFTVDELHEGTEYVAEITAYSPYGKKSGKITGSFKTLSSSSGDGSDDEANDAPTSPEKDKRNPVVKYVANLTDDVNAPTWHENESLHYVTNYKETNSENYGRKLFRDGRGAGDGFAFTFFENAQYITFEFEVEKDGIYDLLAITDTAAENQVMNVLIDEKNCGTFTAPANGVWYVAGTDYTSVGKFTLKAGLHTVTFKNAAQLNDELHFWGVALALETEASVLEIDVKDSTNLSHGANCSMYDAVTLIYDSVAASFTVDIPVEGAYDIYANLSTDSAKDHTFTLAVDGMDCFSQTVKTLYGPDGTEKIKLNEQIPLTKGTHTITFKTQAYGDNYAFLGMSGFTLFREGKESDWSWKRISVGSDYLSNLTDYNMNNGAMYADSFGMGNGCYLTVSVTPSVSGVYEVSYFAAGASSVLNTILNNETVDEQTFDTNGSAAITNITWTTPIELVLLKGYTYDIKVLKQDGGDATLKTVDVKLKNELTSGEGICYDLFAGDYDDTNVEEPTEGSQWPRWGDGRGDLGYSMYGTRYISYNLDVDFSGWYDVSVLAYSPFSATNPASVSVYVDGVLKNTIDSIAQGNTKLSNSLGSIFLLKGTHEIKILNNGGDMDYFKTSLKYVKGDDGTADVSFIYDCLSYTQKGGSNVQEYTSPYNGMVIAEGNSFAEYKVNVPAGNYAFEICYGAEGFDASMSITLNGGMLGVYSLPQNDTFIHKPDYNTESFFTPEILSLNAGTNTIKLRCENGKYFSFTQFKLTRLSEPTLQLYSGEYVVPGKQIKSIVNGTDTVRAFLPNYFEGDSCSMVVCIYENGRLFKTKISENSDVKVGDVLIATFEDVALNSDKTYTMKAFFWNSTGEMVPLCGIIPAV